jgi:hypothetical protein
MNSKEESNPIEDEDRLLIRSGLKSKCITDNKELINLLYSPWILLEGLSIAVTEHPSERTLAKPKLGIIVSKLTRLYDSIGEYLKLSITDSLTDSDRLFESDRLYESLLNCEGGTENTQLKFIENEKYIYFWSLQTVA